MPSRDDRTSPDGPDLERLQTAARDPASVGLSNRVLARRLNVGEATVRRLRMEMDRPRLPGAGGREPR